MTPLRLYLRLLLIAAFMPLLTACGMFGHESVAVENVADSASYAEAGKPAVSAMLDVDYPSGGDPLMVRGVKQWMGALLGLTDTTAMAGAEQFATAFFTQNEPGKEMLKNHPAGYRYHLTVRKADETAAYVTFVVTTEATDGPTVTATCTGATFLKPTAKVFGYEMFVEDKPRSIALMVAEGLKETLGAETLEDLKHFVAPGSLSSSDCGVNALPQAAPWIEDGEMVFQYAQGELRDGSFGPTQARVPLSKAEKFFSATFRRALEEAAK